MKQAQIIFKKEMLVPEFIQNTCKSLLEKGYTTQKLNKYLAGYKLKAINFGKNGVKFYGVRYL